MLGLVSNLQTVNKPLLTLALSCADAYYGSNTKIRDTLNNLILKVCLL